MHARFLALIVCAHLTSSVAGGRSYGLQGEMSSVEGNRLTVSCISRDDQKTPDVRFVKQTSTGPLIITNTTAPGRIRLVKTFPSSTAGHTVHLLMHFEPTMATDDSPCYCEISPFNLPAKLNFHLSILPSASVPTTVLSTTILPSSDGLVLKCDASSYFDTNQNSAPSPYLTVSWWLHSWDKSSLGRQVLDTTGITIKNELSEQGSPGGITSSLASILKIQGFARTKSGYYTCKVVVDWSSGAQFSFTKNAYVGVVETCSRPQLVPADMLTTLECPFASQEASTFYWKKDGRPLPDVLNEDYKLEGIYGHKNNILTIYRLNLLDSGRYTCVGVKGTTTVVKDFCLEVEGDDIALPAVGSSSTSISSGPFTMIIVALTTILAFLC